MFTELSFRLGISEGLSLGELIRPICITILDHNLPLFIDICLIMRYYLWIFIYLCMLDDSWRMNCWILMEKKAFRCNFVKIKKIPEKYGKILFFQKMKES